MKIYESINSVCEELFGPYPDNVALMPPQMLAGYLQKPHIAQIPNSKIDGLTVTVTNGLTDQHQQKIYPDGYSAPPLSGASWFDKRLPNEGSAGLGFEFVFLTPQPAEFPIQVLAWMVNQQLQLQCDFAHHLRYSSCVTSGPYGGPYVPEGVEQTSYIALLSDRLFKPEFALRHGKCRFVVVTNISKSDLELCDTLGSNAEFYKRLIASDLDLVTKARKLGKT